MAESAHQPHVKTTSRHPALLCGLYTPDHVPVLAGMRSLPRAAHGHYVTTRLQAEPTLWHAGLAVYRQSLYKKRQSALP